MNVLIKSPFLEIPTIETERLIIRRHRMEDFDSCAAMWADPSVTRHIGGKPFTAEEVWTKLLRYLGHWAMLGFGYWAIEEKTTHAFAGELGFADFKRDITPSLEDMPELGWVLASHMHGKGYATEAVRAVIKWGQNHFATQQTVCLIHPENNPSIRLAARCGFQELVRTAYKGQPTIIFIQ